MMGAVIPAVKAEVSRLEAAGRERSWEWGDETAPRTAWGAEHGSVYCGDDPDLWIYRDQTIYLLKRYLRLSIETGRLPSLLGREFFRSRVTSYHLCTFEDVVIFVHDVQRSLEKLDRFSQELVAKIVLLEYTHGQTARLLGCRPRTVERRYPEALDQLSEIFLKGGILKPMIAAETRPRRSCQEAGSEENAASDWQGYK